MHAIIEYMKRFAVICLLLLVFLMPVSEVLAVITLPYAGLVTMVVPCTCSGGLWINYAPFYLGGSVVAPDVPLIFMPVPIGPSILFADLMIGVLGVIHLGDYVPLPPLGVSPCFVGSPPFCAPLPAFGIINKVGTNRLGF